MPAVLRCRNSVCYGSDHKMADFSSFSQSRNGADANMVEILQFKPNPFNGAVVDRTALPNDPDDFDALLAASMKQWMEDGFLTVWLDIPKTLSALIPKAIDRGFDFHHTGEDYILSLIHI